MTCSLLMFTIQNFYLIQYVPVSLAGMTCSILIVTFVNCYLFKSEAVCIAADNKFLSLSTISLCFPRVALFSMRVGLFRCEFHRSNNELHYCVASCILFQRVAQIYGELHTFTYKCVASCTVSIM